MSEEIERAIREKKISKVVSCPSVPIQIDGITAADAFDAGDCFGKITEIRVPLSGIIYSATFWDFDDEGSQIDLEIFKASIIQTASDAAWDPTDVDMLKFVTELAFVAFDDHISSRTSELTNIGKAYTAPDGKFWIQAVCRGTPNIAATAIPRFQLQIIPDDPDWLEV